MSDIKSVVILVDEDNISADFANRIYGEAQSHGRIDICRVYVDTAHPPTSGTRHASASSRNLTRETSVQWHGNRGLGSGPVNPLPDLPFF